MSETKYRPDIDGLRAIAVLAVIFFHLDLDGFSGGYVGVDVFFVISGYLISKIIVTEHARGTFTFKNFYIRRVRRLAPALLFTLLVCMLFGFALLTPDHLTAFFESLLATVFSVSNVYFWTQSGYFDLEALNKPLLHTWSLSVEEQFYLLWPAMLLVILKFARGTLVPLVITGLAILSLLFSQEWTQSDLVGAFYLTPFRGFEFAIGALLVWVKAPRWMSGFKLELLYLCGLLMIAASIFYFEAGMFFPGYSALLPCIGAAFMMYAGEARVLPGLLRNRVMVGIGLISYSLYLIHWPIIVYYQYFWGRKLDMLEVVSLVTVSMIAASLMFFFVERPYRRKLNGRYRIAWDARLVWAVALLAGIILVPSVHAITGNGWKWRIDNTYIVSIKEHRARKKDICLPETNDRSPFDCQLGSDTAAVTHLLFGDSHAGHFFPVADALGKDFRTKVLASSLGGCAPLLIDRDYLRQLTNYKNDIKRFEECWQRNEAIRQFLIEQEPRVVLLGASWRLYVPGRSKHRLDLDAVPPDSQVRQDLFAAAIIQTVEFLEQHGHSVAIVSNVPANKQNPNECVSKPFSSSFLDKCLKDTDVRRNKRWNYANDMLRLLHSRNLVGSDLVDPARYLCTEGRCKIFADEALLYRDAGHLSWAGSLYLKPLFRELFDPI